MAYQNGHYRDSKVGIFHINFALHVALASAIVHNIFMRFTSAFDAWPFALYVKLAWRA